MTPLWPPDLLCVYCGFRAAELVAVVNGESRCIDRQDCAGARAARGIRSEAFRFVEKTR